MIDIDALAEKVGMKRDGEFWYSEGGDEFDVKHEHLVALMNLVAAAEREAVAKMFDEPMRLVPFVQNHLGGCVVCGFTPAMAAAAIRARGQA